MALGRPPGVFRAGLGGRARSLRDPDPCLGQGSPWGEGVRPADDDDAFALCLLRGHRLLLQE